MTTDTLDRDIIDTSLPSAEDHLAVDRELCRRVISHRVPEFQPDDIAGAFHPSVVSERSETDPGPAIWIEISERLVDALGEIEERLTRIEADLKR